MLPAAGGQSTAQGQSSVLPGWRQGFCSQTGLLSLPPHLLQERYGHRPVVYVGFMAFRGLELQSGGCGAGVGPQSRLLSLLLRCAEELTHRKSSCHRHPRVTAPHSRLLSWYVLVQIDSSTKTETRRAVPVWGSQRSWTEAHHTLRISPKKTAFAHSLPCPHCSGTFASFCLVSSRVN